MRRLLRRRKPEPTIALINIVFLMLVFFLVAGTLAQPLESALSLVQIRALEGQAPPDALVVHSDGSLSHGGATLADAAAFLQGRGAGELARVRLLPDRALPAAELVRLAQALRAGGAQSVVIVTEQALP